MRDDIRSTLRGMIEAWFPALFRASRLSPLARPGFFPDDRVCDESVKRVRRLRPSLNRRNGITLLSLLWFTFSGVALEALDPHKQVGQYGHHSWTPEGGLPGESVYQILQSKDGYLWIRTGSGLARFDGVRFVPMDAEIESVLVRAICMSTDGDLLIQTNTRTLIYKDGQFSDYLPPGSLGADGTIRQIFESREHELFAGASNFVYRIAKDGKSTIIRESTGWINAFLEDHTGRIWIAGTFALFSYRGGRLSEPIDTTASGFKITSLCEDHLHRLWAGTTKGMYRIDDDGSKLIPFHQPGVPQSITAVLEDQQGNIWLGTEKSELARLADKKSASIGDVRGLTDENVLSLLEDREGSLWIGTANGLDQLRDTDMTTFTTKEGLPSNRVNSAIVTRDGTLHAFTDDGGLARINNDFFTAYAENSRLPSLGGSALFESRDGSLWIGTTKGLSRVRDGKLTVYSAEGLFANCYIPAISEDDESLIFSCDKSLIPNSKEMLVFRFKDRKVLPFTIRGGTMGSAPMPAYTMAIYRDPSGTLWFGTAIGLFKIPPAGYYAAGWQRTVNFSVESIFDDRHGNLWLGGSSPGLTQFRIRDGRVTHFTKRDGLFDGFLSHVLSDDEGNLWISTAHGIYSVSEKALEDFADGETTSISSRRYGLEDGMKTIEASEPGSQPGGARTPDGRLWFTTVKGIVVLDPQHLMHNRIVPPVFVESVVADGVSRPFSGSLDVSPGMKAIEFQYTALSFRVPDRVQFRYRLEGYDHEWVDPGSRRVAYYTNLPPGKYRFRVIAANDDGLWNQQGAAVNIVLEPQFYQTGVFDAGCFVLTILIGIAASRAYTGVIGARARYLSLVVDKRTAELQESHRELEQLAHYDPLTALANRRMFLDDFHKMLEEMKGQQKGFALLLLDFDNFKRINDTFGHDAGDAFLVEASKRLASVVRASDLVARLGGDEFAILLAGGQDQEGIVRVCDRILHFFSAPIDFGGANIVTTVSIGVAVFPEHGETEDELYKAADLALYEAKGMGRNNWRWYHPETQDLASSEAAAVASGDRINPGP
jgi:diguanylate cyclase (GGDEF)-like protein